MVARLKGVRESIIPCDVEFQRAAIGTGPNAAVKQRRHASLSKSPASDDINQMRTVRNVLQQLEAWCGFAAANVKAIMIVSAVGT